MAVLPSQELPLEELLVGVALLLLKAPVPQHSSLLSLGESLTH